MGKLVAIGHRRPGQPPVTRFDRDFFGKRAVVGRIGNLSRDERDTLIRHMETPDLTAGRVVRDPAKSGGFVTGFLVFTFGLLAGYLWAAVAYGKLGIS